MNWFSLFREDSGSRFLTWRHWEEKKDEYLLTMALPGMDEVRLTATGDGFLVMTRATGDTVSQEYPVTLLPSLLDKVDTTAISADYRRGVLSIHLPKRVSARARDVPVAMLD